MLTWSLAADESSRFEVGFDAGAVVSLRGAGDPRPKVEFIDPGQRLGQVSVRFRRPGGDWQAADTADLAATTLAGETGALYQSDAGLVIRSGFEIRQDSLSWTIVLENRGAEEVEIGDLALPLPMNTSYRNKTPAVLKHSFVSGDGSFWYWLPPDSAPPWLVLTPAAGTHFEYWLAKPDYRVFIHSSAAGAEAAARGTRWRQPHTSLTLAQAGEPGATRSYGCTFRWAASREEVRRILVEDGGLDVHVVPGMTVPNDLAARFALRCTEPIHAVTAEFPDQTRIRELGRNNGRMIYQVEFGRLGENRLEVSYGDDRRMFLEFFSTEPLETMFRKRAAFIASRQHRDPLNCYLGSDYRGPAGNGYTLSYMSPMGGWAVLDHALHHAADPAPLIRLGYASFLSSWALLNSGTAASNHGFWYPGPDHDGAAGGGFEPAPFGLTWLEQPHHRGAWYYACETDLGFCAAMRTAATVLTDDPIFGRFCFGGEHRAGSEGIEVTPRDGLRQRFHARIAGQGLDIAISPARFAADVPMIVQPDLSAIEFTVEARNPAPRPLTVRIGGGRSPAEVSVDGIPRPARSSDGGAQGEVEIPDVGHRQRIAIRLSGAPQPAADQATSEAE